MSIEHCPIWGNEYGATGSVSTSNNIERYQVTDSPRAGGGYTIVDWKARLEIDSLTDPEKARLTTWLVDQRLQLNWQPEITEAVVNTIKAKRPLPVHERADRLLRFMVVQSTKIEDAMYLYWVSAMANEPYWGAMAWTESTTFGDVQYLLEYLISMGWVSEYGQNHYRVTVDGYSHISDLGTSVDSSQAFVAMWFDPTMTDAYQRGIEPAIQEAGYKPSRIDQKEHLNKIDDEIIAEIRRSRFLVADFTQGSDGARGGVYYEAGFAHGLGLPVIFTCHKDSVETLHFDTNHYNHIIWTDHEELSRKLKNRIIAVIGEGPETHRNL